MPTTQEVQGFIQRYKMADTGAGPNRGTFSSSVTTPTPTPTPKTDTTNNNTDTGSSAIDTYQRDLAASQAGLDRAQELQRQSLIDVITKKYDSRVAGIEQTGAEELARTRALNLRSGLIESPQGSTELGSTKAKTQAALDANEAAKADEIRQQLLALDGIYYQRKRDLTTDKLQELKTNQDLRANEIALRDERRQPAKEALLKLAKNSDFDSFAKDPIYQEALDSGDFTEKELREIFYVGRDDKSIIQKGTNGNMAWQLVQMPDGTQKVETTSLPFDTTEYDTTKNGDTMIFVPKNFDGDTSKIKTYKMGGGGDTETSLSILDVQRYNELYPEAGVIAGDSEKVANDKIIALNSPEAKIRNLVVAAKDANNSYETVIKEIENDTTITDKETAKNIANEVYGKTTDINKFAGQELRQGGEPKPLTVGQEIEVNGLWNFLFNK